MNCLPFARQVQTIALLTEGMSIRGIERMTGTNRNTIMNLGKRVGDACHRLHDARMRGLQVSCLEIDETWSFVRKKQKNVQDDDPQRWGTPICGLASMPTPSSSSAIWSGSGPQRAPKRL